jgi:hypothetical protein
MVVSKVMGVPKSLDGFGKSSRNGGFGGTMGYPDLNPPHFFITPPLLDPPTPFFPWLPIHLCRCGHTGGTRHDVLQSRLETAMYPPVYHGTSSYMVHGKSTMYGKVEVYGIYIYHMVSTVRGFINQLTLRYIKDGI